MPVPTYQEMMLPLLRVLAEANAEIRRKEATQRVADAMGISPEDRASRMPSGTQTHLFNRMGWAAWSLQQAGLLEKPRRGGLLITAEGKKLLETKPVTIDNKMLAANYPGFEKKLAQAQAAAGGGESDEDSAMAAADTGLSTSTSTLTPTDQIEQAEVKLNGQLAAELLEIMGRMDPYKFEQLVVDLLFAMGYGGSRAEAARVTQRSNDEGIDGIISQDRLGLDVIYVQAKRWQSSIGREPIQSFVGALAGKHANKGVFITTSDFHKNAVEYARGVQHKIILINGQRLAQLMIEHGIGVSTVRTIAIKRVDSDYFEDA
ncbi:restriction endonuclease [Prosthecobacter sp.]|uniref:restriction endonuclease n=1 Tax=Prosthecobacter sp. TaxID=1965333 RepID=UPI003782EBAF